MCLLGFACNQENSIELKDDFTLNSEKNYFNNDYESIRLDMYKSIKENWDKNFEEVEKYTLEAFNKNEGFVKTKKVNNDKIIKININYKI